jgi:ADP-ribosylglycohydrolase
MALCLAESVLDTGGIDLEDQLRRYLLWTDEGYLSSNGRCFDIGNAVRAALERFEGTREPYCGSTNPQTAGNGSIMRLARVALLYAQDPRQAIEKAVLSSRTTHGAQEAVDACRYFAGLTVGAIRGLQ